MSARQFTPRHTRLHVLIATPLGKGGHGGIDRVVDEVRHQMAVMRPTNLEVTYLTTRGRGHIGLSPIYFGWALLRLAMRRLAGRADLLHVNLSSHGSTIRKVLICRAARALRVPYVIHLHGSRFRQFYGARGKFGVRQILAMFRGAARIVVLGTVWQAFITEQMPDMAGAVEVLPNATRAPVIVEPRHGRVVNILFLGKVGKRKGVPQIIDAFERLFRLPGWTGTIAGDGEVEQVRADVRRRGLSGRVSLTGWVGPAEVDRLLLAADILVLPSFDENLPMSVIEGMGHGLAVVATPVGAVADIVKDGETGLLVAAGDAEQLAAALSRLIGDGELRARLGRQARIFHQENLHIDSYLPRLVGIWRAAAADPTRGPMRRSP